MKDSIIQGILEVKAIELKEDDVIVVTYSKDHGDHIDEVVNALADDVSGLCKKKKVYCICLPEGIKFEKMAKEETIKQLESIIEELRK